MAGYTSSAQVKVSGSDIARSTKSRELENSGITVSYNQEGELINPSISLVVKAAPWAKKISNSKTPKYRAQNC